MEILQAFKFLLLLNGVRYGLSEICPPKCQCIQSSVRCIDQELTVMPTNIPTNAQTLDIRFNNISEIASENLSHLDQLRSLLLNDNHIEMLRSGAFYGLHNLKYLYLYRNRIHHIDSDVFQGLQNLEQLYLHMNQIHHIEPETFSEMPRLERLYLHNNILRTIPPSSFKGMPKLTKLRLDNNFLMCDCSILWFVQLMTEHRHMKITATCHGPTTLTGISLATVKEHNLHCKQPEIENEPSDVEIHFGDDAMFTCVATGEPIPKIVWLHDSKEILLEATQYQVMDNGSLVVHGADENNVGIFECMAKNPAGEVRSKAAKLILKENSNQDGYPKFMVVPHKQLAKFYQPYVNLDCKANGNPKPHIAWFFNEQRILLNQRISIHENGSIVIKDVEHTEAGMYTCQAENIHGVIRASAVLEVIVQPTILSTSMNKTVDLGNRVEFTCMTRGVPKPLITWYRNAIHLPISSNVILSNDNQSVTILKVTKADNGIYICRAENSEGLREITYVLKVKEAEFLRPKIVLKPENTDAFKATSIQLPCEVEGPSAVIEWRKNGSPVILNEKVLLSQIGSLIINNVTVQDAGRYECLASNAYGRDTVSFFLSVKDHTLPSDEYVNMALIEASRDIDQAITKTMQQLFNNENKKKKVHDFFRIVRFPNAPAREIARAAEIYERTLDKIKTFVLEGVNATPAEPFNYHSVLSAEHLDVIARLSGCVAHREEINCSATSSYSKYRTVDGSCNNLVHPTWGTSLTGFRRILDPVYENGFSQPVGWNKNLKYNGFTLPSPRLISTKIISTTDLTEDVQISHMTMQWGQWLDHDLDHALPPTSSQSWDGVDCKKTCDYAAPCFPIDVPFNDTRISNRRCIDFIRTSAVCGSGMTSVLFGTLQPREQINQLTSFLDASQVYGFDITVAQDLRDLTNDNGLLRVGASFTNRKPSLPTAGLNGMDCRRNLEESSRNCFVAGDIRANEQIGLAAMHTIWMREHNRIANILKTLNPIWDGDKVYQETRKVVGAEMQAITYQHWLPIVLGPNVHQHLGEYKEYNPDINPSISNVFATAALRFGHSMINPVLHRYDENFDPIPEGHLQLRYAFFSPWRLVEEGGVDPLLRGMFTTPAKLKTPTQNLNSELTEQLFFSAHAVALDLAAINIQRGRDHAIPPYTKWREFCNMSRADDFDDLANEISDKNVRDKLQELYGSVHNIDIWVGGILEDQVDGGKVGPLFRCLLLEQFKRLRDGDRFWYENPMTFNAEQLQQIKNTSLARILCDNGDNIDTIGENVFLLPEIQDGLISCEDLPTVDLRLWTENTTR